MVCRRGVLWKSTGRASFTASHTVTCGGNHRDANHLDGEGVLVATERGWMCLYCDYTQNWASESIEKLGLEGDSLAGVGGDAEKIKKPSRVGKG